MSNFDDVDKIARMITEDPDIFCEGWEKLGIVDPDFKNNHVDHDPAQSAANKYKNVAWNRIADRLSDIMPFEYQKWRENGPGPVTEIDEILIDLHGIVMSSLIDDINREMVDPKDDHEILDHLNSMIEIAIKNR